MGSEDPAGNGVCAAAESGKNANPKPHASHSRIEGFNESKLNPIIASKRSKTVIQLTEKNLRIPGKSFLSGEFLL